jgi:23S rRNA (pseudouridine1915-N3)-methyltransferase
MLSVTLICVGRIKEKFYADAVNEYLKRLGAYCKTEVIELPETPRGSAPSEIDSALRSEAAAVTARIPKGAAVIAMCIEGREISSESLADTIDKYASSGVSRLCFLIGGSDGLHEVIKKSSDLRLSMSKMTFPHHLARVMLLEQIYRSFKINEGSPYHK